MVIFEGSELLFKVLVVFFFCFVFLGEDRYIRGSNGGSGVVLGVEDVVVGLGNFSIEGSEGFDEDGGLDGYVKVVSNVGIFERLVGGVFFVSLYEIRYFVFS